MKIRFTSDDNLPSVKTFNALNIIILAASALEKTSKCYPQCFLHECAYKL